MPQDKIYSRIELKENESGLLWPYFQDQKAWSASSLTSILKEIEYADKQIPQFVLLKAAQNGKLFHQIIQAFVQDGSDLSAYPNLSVSGPVQKKLQETIIFLEKNQQTINNNCFLGSERLHYTFYKGVLIASYIDLEFEDFAVELKSNNIKMNESPLTLLSFQIQLLIQHLCSQKDIYLLWSTGNGVIFHKFCISEELLKILEILINLVKKGNDCSISEKRSIIEKILEGYSPQKLIGDAFS